MQVAGGKKWYEAKFLSLRNGKYWYEGKIYTWKGEGAETHSVPAVKQMIFYVLRWMESKDLECLWWIFHSDL